MSSSARFSLPTVAVNTDIDDIDHLLEKEWLLTNRRGSYASGTVIGCNTRRYHGLLVASLNPPVQRVVTLSNLLEKITLPDRAVELAHFEFADCFHPRGFQFLNSFQRDLGVQFTYHFDNLTIEKSVYLDSDQDLVLITYDFTGLEQRLTFSLLPLLALRDFHSLLTGAVDFRLSYKNNLLIVRTAAPDSPVLQMACPNAAFHAQPDFWHNFHYRAEARRGQDNKESLFTPGTFEITLDAPSRVTFVAWAGAARQKPPALQIDPEEFVEKLYRRARLLIDTACCSDAHEAALTLAADQFIVHRRISRTRSLATILAGYPWFADWGRDAFISLPGLLLATNRFDEAAQVLATFAAAIEQGMIPNRFDDYGGEPLYNSVDASLWFINAAWQYLLATKDVKYFRRRLLPAIIEIVTAYHTGTHFDIHADSDSLITAGSADTQLTWMDARCNGVSFTPRYGKAVEINALWYNALCICCETASGKQKRKQFADLAGAVRDSFNEIFWNETGRYLYDCVLPNGRADKAIRPNQIFAVSLPFSPLSSARQLAVVNCVSEYLLTPYGLRSLSPADKNYQPYYRGDRFARDRAYHQGTVWAWLIGPFVEAWLKANSFSPHARLQAAEIITPLLEHINSDACIGQVCEIFDGDYPHAPNGCIAQAWSTAELLRIKKLLRQT